MMAAVSSPHPFLRFSAPLSSDSTRRPPLSSTLPSSPRYKPPAASSTTYSSPASTRLRSRGPSSSPSSSFYEILGLPIGATEAEIKAAYRRLARVCHPDVAGDDRDDSPAGGEFMRIHAAYATLSDREKRADYDRQLFRRFRKSFSGLSASPGGMSGFSGYSRPHWETDQCW